MAEQQKPQIIAGPSVKDLFLALLLHHEERRVTFTVVCQQGGKEEKKILKVFVYGINVGNGVGTEWMVTLYDPKGTLDAGMLEGRFNTETRKGWICPIVQSTTA